jgi:hypothetical protein
MPDIIYVLTNEAMPGLVKIGLTTDSIESRISSLSATTSIPLPFECFFAAEVANCGKLEKQLHQLFSESRINPKREFFKVDPEKVVLAISIGDFKEITPGLPQVDLVEQAALEQAKARRPRLRLEALGINPGATLTFSRDETITAMVLEGGRLNFNGEVMSSSAAALKALHGLGYSTPAASGSGYWKFDGELLDERRRRMETEQFDESPSAVD